MIASKKLPDNRLCFDRLNPVTRADRGVTRFAREGFEQSFVHQDVG